MNVSLTHIALLIGYAAVIATGNLVMEAAALRLRASAAHTVYEFVVAAMSNAYLWIGLSIYAVSLVIWLWLLSFIPLRYAYPLAATSLLIVPLVSGLMTRDFPAPLYWVGIVLVIIGLTLAITK